MRQLTLDKVLVRRTPQRETAPIPMATERAAGEAWNVEEEVLR